MFVAVPLTAGALAGIATSSTAEPVGAIVSGLLLAAYVTVAVPVGPVLGLLCGSATGLLVTVAVVPGSRGAVVGGAVAVVAWAVLWPAEPTGTIRSLTPWPPVDSPVLLFGCVAAAVHAVLLQRWRRTAEPAPVGA